MRTRGRRRSARELPRYVIEKPLSRGRVGYYFNLPIWARGQGCEGCPVANEALGTDKKIAIARAEDFLLPAFDGWLRGDATAKQDNDVAKIGTLDWMFAEFQKDRRFFRRQKDRKPSSAKH